MAVASSGSVRAGGAFVELFCKDGALLSALARARRAVGQFGSFMMGVGMKAGVAGGLLLGPLIGLFTKAIGRASALDDLADAFKTTVEELAPMAHGFEVAGLSLDDMGKAMQMTGLDAAGLAAKIAELNAIEDPAARNAAFKDTLGAKTGLKLSKIAGDLPELMKNAPIIDTQTAKDAEKTGFAWNRAMLSMQTAMLPLISVLTPLIELFSKFVQRNADVLRIVAAVGAVLLGLSVVTTIVGFAFSGLAAIMGLLGTIMGLLGTAVSFLLTPLGLLVGGLVALAVTLPDWKSLFGTLKDTGMKAIQGITDALRAGNLELAWKIALAGLKLAWHDTVLWMRDQLDSLRNFAGGKDGRQSDIGKVLRWLSPAWGAVTADPDNPIAKAIQAPQRGKDGARAALDEELAALLKLAAEARKKAEGGDGAKNARVVAAESVKGLFQSPNFARALGFGDGGKVQDRIADANEKQVALLEDINDKMGGGAVFA